MPGSGQVDRQTDPPVVRAPGLVPTSLTYLQGFVGWDKLPKVLCIAGDDSHVNWFHSSSGKSIFHHHHHHHHLNREGRCGTTDDFTVSFLYFSLFSTALWDLANSRPVHSLMLSSHLFLCLPCLLPKKSIISGKLVWNCVLGLNAGLINGLICAN